MVAKIIHQIWQIFLVEEVEIGVGRVTKIHFKVSCIDIFIMEMFSSELTLLFQNRTMAKSISY